MILFLLSCSYIYNNNNRKGYNSLIPPGELEREMSDKTRNEYAHVTLNKKKLG